LRRDDGREPVYVIRWFEGGRKRERSTGTGRRQDAEDALADFLVRQEHRSQGRPRPRDPHDVLVTDLLTAYVTEHAGAATDADRIAAAVTHLTAYFHGRTAGDVNRQLCQAYGAQRVYERGPEGARYTRPAAPGTIRRELEVLRAAINHGHRQRRLLYAPHVFLPAKPRRRDVWLTRDEVASLLRAARANYHTRRYLPRWILVTLYMASRKTAIAELTWSMIDLATGLIDPNPPGRAETAKRRAVIRAPRRLLAHLRRWKRTAHSEWVIEKLDEGEWRPVRDVKKGLKAAGRAIGRDDVTPHVLRHTAGTWMAQAGVPMHQIGGYLGHSTAEATEIYMHHHPDFQKEAAEALMGRRA
jgi:integrase